MRTVYPTYGEESVDAAYPFESGATRTSGDASIEDDVFVDGRFFPPDGRWDLYISSIVVSEEVVITIADASGTMGTGSFTRNDPPEYVTFATETGIYLGLLQGYSVRDSVTDPIKRGLHKLAGWSNGTYTFSASATRFAATVVVPQPQECVRAIRLDSGAIFFGDVYLVGENGVQLTNASSQFLSSSSSGIALVQGHRFDDVIRVDIIGDPLYVRRGCEGEEVVTDQDILVQSLVFKGTTILPDVDGGLNLTVATQGASEQPALRVLPIQYGLEVSFING